MARKYIFLKYNAGATESWSVPSDWNDSDNTIECIGPGANGFDGLITVSDPTDASDGGGGGAYAKKSNLALTPLSSVSYRVGNIGDDTWFNGASLAASSVGAHGARGRTGGTTASSVGDTKFAGGSGGLGPNGTSGGGGGG
jgi:hypothetical protein